MNNQYNGVKGMFMAPRLKLSYILINYNNYVMVTSLLLSDVECEFDIIE